MRRHSLSAVFVSVVLLLPARVLACAVCLNGANDNSRKAFFDMTMLMTFLPLILLGAGIGWLAWKARDILASEFEDRDEPTLSAAAEGVDAGA